METYLNQLQHILNNGKERTDRTGTGTIGVFGYQDRYDLRKGFPAVTTKKLAWKAVVSELLWFIEGSGDERRLAEILFGSRDVGNKTIWTANAESPAWKAKATFTGDLGRVYGVQWRSWNGKVDQLQNLIDGIKTDPYGRRHIITAWNPGELTEIALPPCHCFAQFYVCDGELSCHMYQRSLDALLGGPFNIASYSLLTHMIAQVCGLKVGDFVHSIGDLHIYSNHVEQVNLQLSRKPLSLPTLKLNTEIKNIDRFTMSDITLEKYMFHPPIQAPMAV